MLERIFGLVSHGTSVRNEVVGGISTFLAMSYIIFVNPMILADAGMPAGPAMTATILASAFATIAVGMWANVPFAMAPGMGLNAFFTYTLVKGYGVSWQTALGAVFFSGVLFLVLALIGAREKIIKAIPVSLRLSLAAGIGLFITLIGFRNMGLIESNPATMVGLGDLANQGVLIGLLGLILIAVLEVRKVPGAILLGILAMTVLAVVIHIAELPPVFIQAPPSIAPIFMKVDFFGALHIGMLGAIFSLMFFDLFDSVGTIVACSYEAGLVRSDGSIDKLDRVLQIDAIATIAGALLGTSTTTSYIESGSGIAAGARTGLSSVVTGAMFLLMLLFTPLLGIVPKEVIAPALIIVGVHMFRSIQKIDFSNFEVSVPSFMLIVIMPLTYSISIGLAFGFISYLIISIAAGHVKKIPVVMWVVGAMSVCELLIRSNVIRF